MQILNLTNPDRSDVRWEKICFPDGEVQIRLGEFSRKDTISVRCRITDAEDLFILMQVADILNRHEVMWSLQIYYLMSMRMDRVIDFNTPFTLKVVGGVIRSLGAVSVSVCEPHSNRTAKEVGSHVMDTIQAHAHFSKDFFNDKIQLCFPDEGANLRYRCKFYLDVSKSPVLIGEKKRNIETGKIEKIYIKNPEDYKGLPVMVVDDLCDAGGTFLGIAKSIREIDKDAKLSISVVHMVNRKGIENLSSAYDQVYFTNTYRDWNFLPDNCNMIDVVNSSNEE